MKPQGKKFWKWTNQADGDQAEERVLELYGTIAEESWFDDDVTPQMFRDSFQFHCMGVYHGAWMPDMDRCWLSDDGYQVTSRIISTTWGKVEHAAIQIVDDNAFLSSNGERDIPWAVKQQIKNELFGEKRLAIEVFPKQKNLVDVQDVYHLWVFPKDFDLPFGIHPIRDKQCKAISRGCPKDAGYLIENTRRMRDIDAGRVEAAKITTNT